MDTKGLTIRDARRLMDKKELSPEELFNLHANKIKKEDKEINSYLSVFEFTKPRAVSDSVLYSIPCAVKDCILIEGEKCTAGSKILENYTAAYDATSVSRLKNAGAIFLGKLNLDEFTMGTTGENSAFGPAKNPHDTSRVAGGSSSGSAAAVCAGLAMYALGTDTGGSIRLPASFCGVVGLKPTYGRVSRYGEIAMASSFDQTGTLTKTVEDAAYVLQHIAGYDGRDASSMDVPVPDYTEPLGRPIAGKRIAVPKEFFGKGLDPQIRDIIQGAIHKLEELGAHVDEVSLPLTDYALAAYYVLVSSEVSANMARYDGIRYGYCAGKEADNLFDIYAKSRARALGAEVKRRIMMGTYALSAGYYDAYYLKASKVRTLIRRDFDRIFSKYDAIVGPTSPVFAPKLGEFNDPLELYMLDVYTVQVNLAGLPAISIPCGTGSVDGVKLPTGLQIIGRQFDESTILQIAYAYEQSRN